MRVLSICWACWQVVGAVDLGPKDLLIFPAILLGDGAIGEHPSGVDHPGTGGPLGGLFLQPGYLCGVRRVASADEEGFKIFIIINISYDICSFNIINLVTWSLIFLRKTSKEFIPRPCL